MSCVERALIRIKHVGTTIAALALSDWGKYYYSGGPTRTYSTMDDIPMVKVQLIQDVRLLPNECTTTTAELVGKDFPQPNQPLLFELDSLVHETNKIQAMETVVSPGNRIYIPMVNHLGFTQRIS